MPGRLVVAMSRARLGLYVFAKAQLFADCYELAPSMKLLTARPQAPALLPKEYHGVCTQPDAFRQEGIGLSADSGWECACPGREGL